MGEDRRTIIPSLIALGKVVASLHKQVSTLNPINVLDDHIWARALELLRAVNNLVEAHGRGDCQRGTGPIVLSSLVSTNFSVYS
jgi:hypothetical protein